VILSLATAFTLDHIKVNFPSLEITTYSIMFFIGGLAGLYGVFVVGKVPEPKIRTVKTNFFRLFKNPFLNSNYRNLMIFNATWAFAINLAAPFFSVYLLKNLHLPLSYVVGFTILTQVTQIFFIRIWGRYSDQYSNKTILRLCGPIYLLCILAWTFTTMPDVHAFTIPLLVIIYIFNGIAIAGINLSMTNIGIKLAPKEGDAIVYLTTRGMVNAFFAGIAPIIGGYFADFFATREFAWSFEWKGPEGNYVLPTLDLQSWDFFFLFAFLLGIFALYRLSFVRERGESNRRIRVSEIASELRKEIKINYTFPGVKSMAYIPFNNLIRRQRIAKYKKEKLEKVKETGTPVYTIPLKEKDQGENKDQKLAPGA
jgi:hypothetical protein